MIELIILSMALNAQTQQPQPCKQYEVFMYGSGAVTVDTVDQYLVKTVFVNPKGDTICILNEYAGIEPQAYHVLKQAESIEQKSQKLDSLLNEYEKEK